MSTGAIPSLESQRLPPSLDARFLRRQARQRIEALASARWTDYNTHDPGITLLEVLAYAVTDLGLRARLPLTDLIAGKENRPFFTAREALPSAPLTPDDFARLLVDRLPVRQAWVMPAPGQLNGLNRLLLDLLPPDDLSVPDLEETWLRGAPDAIQAIGREFYALFPFWELLPPQWFDPQRDLAKAEVLGIHTALDDNSKTYDLFFVALKLTFGTGASAQVLDNFGCWIQLPKGIPKAPPDDDTGDAGKLTAFHQALQTQLHNNPAFFKQHQQRARLRAARLAEARRLLQQHRNLCEDWLETDTIRVQQVGVNIAGLELQPEADPADVLARICFAVNQFIAPLPRPAGFDDLLARGLSPAEIFEGPLLENGFQDKSTPRADRQLGKLYTSDFVRLVMQHPEVVGVNRLTLDLYMERRRIAAGVANCLSLRDTDRYKPRFSFFDTDIRVIKRGVEVAVDQKAVFERWRALEKTYRDGLQRDGTGDLPVPAGDPQPDVPTFYSIQNDFPEAYGLRSGEIASNATKQRKGQARQLKAYLLFFEQLLANYCRQLDRVQDLFSMRTEVDRTYFHQPLYDVPAVQELYQAFLSEKKATPPLSWEQFKQLNNQYVKKLDLATEDRDTFLRRRNQFIDHLLARFAESFADYAAWSYARHGGTLSPDLVFDKLAFLQRAPELGAARARAFDYTATRSGGGGQPAPDVWDTANVSGYEKRVAALLGIPDYRRRTLGEKFDLTRYRETTNLQGSGASQKGQFRLLNAPVGAPTPKILLTSDKAYLVSEMNDRLAELTNGASDARAYQVQQDPDKRAATARYTFELVAPGVVPPKPLPAKAPGMFDNRALLEAHIRETMHLLQGRPAEGMHVVEHILLRPVDGVSEMLAPVVIEGGGILIPEPHEFQVSIFLPSWAPRFQDPEFQAVVERTLRSELPAHVFPYIYWVKLDGNGQVPALFTAFETAWRNWLEKQFTVDRPTAQDQLVVAINQLVASKDAVEAAHRYQPFVL